MALAMAPQQRCFIRDYTRIGVDPGASGALALVGDDAVFEIYDMPRKPGVRPRENVVDILAVIRTLERWAEVHQRPPVYLESVRAFETDKPEMRHRIWTFGKMAGALEAAIVAVGLPTYTVEPQSWKSRARLLKRPKDAARGVAAQLYPDCFAQVHRNTGRADAVLIGRFGPAIHPHHFEEPSHDHERDDPF